MAEHIVERLRNDGGHPDLAHPLCIEAADTIEHLDAIIARFLADNTRLRAERDAERALADQLASALRSVVHDRPTAHSDAVWNQCLEALEAHQEARRG